MKRVLVAVLTVGVLAGGFFAVRAEGQSSKPPTSASGPVGRWQIVQGPPTGLYRTFLIDTVSGDTFIVCGSKDEGIEGWCPMPHLRPK
jgi:hypothetical protein